MGSSFLPYIAWQTWENDTGEEELSSHKSLESQVYCSGLRSSLARWLCLVGSWEWDVDRSVLNAPPVTSPHPYICPLLTQPQPIERQFSRQGLPLPWLTPSPCVRIIQQSPKAFKTQVALSYSLVCGTAWIGLINVFCNEVHAHYRTAALAVKACQHFSRKIPLCFILYS